MLFWQIFTMPNDIKTKLPYAACDFTKEPFLRQISEGILLQERNNNVTGGCKKHSVTNMYYEVQNIKMSTQKEHLSLLRGANGTHPCLLYAKKALSIKWNWQPHQFVAVHAQIYVLYINLCHKFLNSSIDLKNVCEDEQEKVFFQKEIYIDMKFSRKLVKKKR